MYLEELDEAGVRPDEVAVRRELGVQTWRDGERRPRFDATAAASGTCSALEQIVVQLRLVLGTRRRLCMLLRHLHEQRLPDLSQLPPLG